MFRSVVSLVVVALVTAVAGAAVASAGSVVVKRGDRGSAVVQIQKKLHIRADGVFGRQTVRAVKRFQRRKDLKATGKVGPSTRRKLRLKPFAHGSVRGKPPHFDNGTGGAIAGSGASKVKLPSALKRIAECESGGNPKAISPGGNYRGKYQFDRSTWKSIGGDGDPAEAAESEQDKRALKLYRQRGTQPWPNCG